MTSRLFIHVQHLLGIGHQQRADAIANACVQDGMDVVMATGEQSVDASSVEFGVVGLPDIRAADISFSGLVDLEGNAVDDAYWLRRKEILLDGFQRKQPDLLLVEGFPFARRQFRHELIPLLELARASGIKIFCSIRDILQPKSRTDRLQETLNWLETYFDAVLIHGDPAFATLSLSFAMAEQNSVPTLYTGYVSPSIDLPSDAKRGLDILISAGGGAAGATVYETAFAAALEPGADTYRWRFRMGRNAPPIAGLAQGCPAHVHIEEATPDFRTELCSAACSVSQAGYNTAVDLMVTSVPSILIPFSDGGQREQMIRAERMRDTFGSTVLSSEKLTAPVLWEAIKSRKAPLGEPQTIDLGGARRCAAILKRCLQTGLGESASLGLRP